MRAACRRFAWRPRSRSSPRWRRSPGPSWSFRAAAGSPRWRWTSCRRDAFALVDVEDIDLRDELALGALRGAHQVCGLDGAIDHEGEIALDRLERREIERRLRPRRPGAWLRDALHDDLEGDQRSL